MAPLQAVAPSANERLLFPEALLQTSHFSPPRAVPTLLRRSKRLKADRRLWRREAARQQSLAPTTGSSTAAKAAMYKTLVNQQFGDMGARHRDPVDRLPPKLSLCPLSALGDRLLVLRHPINFLDLFAAAMRQDQHVVAVRRHDQIVHAKCAFFPRRR